MREFMLTTCVALLLLSGSAMAQKHPPQYYIDRGACPGECCTYRQWKAEITTQLLSQIGRAHV